METTVNTRENFFQVASFTLPQRIPSYELGVWQQTLQRWFSEGLSRDVLRQDYETGDDMFLGEPFFDIDRRDLHCLPNLNLLPRFKEKILKETDRYITYCDGAGITRKALKDGTVRGMRISMDQYLDYPVKNRHDFLIIKKRLNPHTTGRYPDEWEDKIERRRNRSYLLCARGFGYYWKLRSLMGTEGVSVGFYDQPELIDEICEHLTYFFMETTKKALEKVGLDYFEFSEDFAYKGAPLLSPQMFRRFIMPHYRRIIDFMRGYGVPFFFVDSDGDPSALIPSLIESGVNGLWPLERAAGIDPYHLRKEYGKDLILSGGIDKRALIRGKKAIYDELKSLAPLIEKGGFIPTVDHLISPDVSYENFLYYLEVKEKLLRRKL